MNGILLTMLLSDHSYYELALRILLFLSHFPLIHTLEPGIDFMLVLEIHLLLLHISLNTPMLIIFLPFQILDQEMGNNFLLAFDFFIVYAMVWVHKLW